MENKVLNLIKEELDKNQISVESIEYIKEEGTYFLRIAISKEGFVTSEDCVKATKIINPLLDAADLIEESYILDVCTKERG